MIPCLSGRYITNVTVPLVKYEIGFPSSYGDIAIGNKYPLPPNTGLGIEHNIHRVGFFETQFLLL